MNRSKKHISERAVRHPKYWARGVEYAKELGIESETELLKLCADGQRDASTRGTACLALGCFEYKPAVPVLVKLAEDSDPSLVVNATRALEMIGSPRAVRPMMSLAKDATRVDVRNRAIDVLGTLGDCRAEELLVSILRDREKAKSTRCSAAEALGGMREHSNAAIASLVGALKEPFPLLRWTALNSLGVMGDQSAKRAIQARLADHEVVPELPGKVTVSGAAEKALKHLALSAQKK